MSSSRKVLFEYDYHTHTNKERLSAIYYDNYTLEVVSADEDEVIITKFHWKWEDDSVWFRVDGQNTWMRDISRAHEAYLNFVNELIMEE